MSQMKSPYDTLGVSKDDSIEDIKSAYKRLVNKNHPDKGGDHEQFIAIQKAYELLSDPERRAYYDKYGEEEDKNKFDYNNIAQNEVINLLLHIADQIDPIYNNLIAVAINTVEHNINNFKNSIKTLKFQSKKYKNIYTRLSSKSNNNLVLIGIKNKRLACLNEIKTLIHRLRVSKLVINLLDDYEYKTDVMTNEPVHYRTSNTMWFR